MFPTITTDTGFGTENRSFVENTGAVVLINQLLSRSLYTDAPESGIL